MAERRAGGFSKDRAADEGPKRSDRRLERSPNPRVTVIDSDLAEIHGYLQQPGITADDIHRLCTILESGAEPTIEAASLVLQVALVKPKRNGRLRYLESHRPHLLKALVDAGLVDVSS